MFGACAILEDLWSFPQDEPSLDCCNLDPNLAVTATTANATFHASWGSTALQLELGVWELWSWLWRGQSLPQLQVALEL